MDVRDIKLKSDLAYEEKPVQIIDSMDRVTRNHVIKFHKVMWNNHSEQDATWKGKIIYVRFIPPFMKNGRSFESQDEISIRGRGWNTLVLSMHWALAFHEHGHHLSIHEHKHMKCYLSHLTFVTRDDSYMHVYACCCV